jgi:hypothetical protein
MINNDRNEKTTFLLSLLRNNFVGDVLRENSEYEMGSMRRDESFNI